MKNRKHLLTALALAGATLAITASAKAAFDMASSDETAMVAASQGNETKPDSNDVGQYSVVESKPAEYKASMDGIVTAHIDESTQYGNIEVLDKRDMSKLAYPLILDDAPTGDQVADAIIRTVQVVALIVAVTFAVFAIVAWAVALASRPKSEVKVVEQKSKEPVAPIQPIVIEAAPKKTEEVEVKAVIKQPEPAPAKPAPVVPSRPLIVQYFNCSLSKPLKKNTPSGSKHPLDTTVKQMYVNKDDKQA